MYSLIKSLGGSGFEIDLVDPYLGWHQAHGSEAKTYFAEQQAPRLSHWQRAVGLRKFLRGRHYDVCNVHYNSAFYGLLAGTLRKSADRLVVSIWGSDMTNTSALICRMQRRLLNFADVVTINNPDQRELLCRRFQIPESKVATAYMPLELLDKVDSQLEAGMTPGEARRALGFEPDRPMVLCGTNAWPAQHHHEILDSLEGSFESAESRSGVQFVFPLTYGRDSNDYIDGLLARTANSELSTYCLTEFLSDDDMALLRIASDGVIQVQRKDMFSAVMQEALFAGGWVLTGDWLPYEFLKSGAPTLHCVADVSGVGPAVQELLTEGLVLADAEKSRDTVLGIAGLKPAGEVWQQVWRG